MTQTTLILSFGRLNPMTQGHQALIQQMIDLKRQSYNTTAIIYLSNTQDSKKNPLFPQEKLKYINKLFPTSYVHITYNPDIKNLFSAVIHHSNQFDNLIVLCGKDREQEYTSKLNQYNHKEFEYASIRVIADDRETVGNEQVSGTMLRNAVLNNDKATFANGLMGTAFTKKESLINEIFDLLKTRLQPPKTKRQKLKESVIGKLLKHESDDIEMVKHPNQSEYDEINRKHHQEIKDILTKEIESGI